MNSSLASLPVPSGLGNNSVICGAIMPIFATGITALGAKAPLSVPSARLTIVAGGSGPAASWVKPLCTIWAGSAPLTSSQGLDTAGWTACQLPAPGTITDGLLPSSSGKRRRKAAVLDGRVWAPAAAVLDQP